MQDPQEILAQSPSGCPRIRRMETFGCHVGQEGLPEKRSEQCWAPQIMNVNPRQSKWIGIGLNGFLAPVAAQVAVGCPAPGARTAGIPTPERRGQ